MDLIGLLNLVLSNVLNTTNDVKEEGLAGLMTFGILKLTKEKFWPGDLQPPKLFAFAGYGVALIIAIAYAAITNADPEKVLTTALASGLTAVGVHNGYTRGVQGK